MINAFWLMLGALGIYAIFYRYYSRFLATRVVVLDDARPTPAHQFKDGHNYHPTNKWVLWGHHFAAIAGAGPLIGPVLALQFGYFPGWLWLVFGVCLGGAVQDFVILAASIRRRGRSLAEIARSEISGISGTVAMVAILFIVVVALAVLGFVVVNALAESAWGTFAIAASIPIALLMGLYMYRIRPGRVGEASAIGVALLVLAVVAGPWVVGEAHHPTGFGRLLLMSRDGITTSMLVYGFIASALPVWLLLCPRDYLSSYMKVGTVVLIVAAVLVVNPPIQAPAFSQFLTGGGPLVPGPIYPFAFITIACGAISGFHSLVSSGTTPKMLDRESHARPIGYGAMLMESLVGVTALVAAASLPPADYYAINLTPEKFARLGLGAHNLSELAQLVGESTLVGRTGGGVSLAVGISQIFGNFPGLGVLMKYFYHFVIMFEALFVLTTVDTGTRIARFLVQEFGSRLPKQKALGKRASAGWVGAALVVAGIGLALTSAVNSVYESVPWIASLAPPGLVIGGLGGVLLVLHPKIGQTDWMPGTVGASFLVAAGWAYFIYTGSIQTLWPMFGVANQLLAVVALVIGTSVIINEGRARYAWVTILPMAFVGVTTLSAGYLSIRDNFIGTMTKAMKNGLPDHALRFQGYLNATLTAIMMACVVAILIDAVPRWVKHWANGRQPSGEPQPTAEPA
ncbi:MAG: carbon starvation protein A [Armatimonadetes bacterium]|nr:carbon starvation protein A [Armatimonadota bacterium]